MFNYAKRLNASDRDLGFAPARGVDSASRWSICWLRGR